MELLTRNAKMKRSSHRTFNFGIPAFMSVSGMKTCPKAGQCAKGCYAKSGAYTWPQVKNAYESRLNATMKASFVDIMCYEIERKKAQVIRIHDSGDFYSTVYLDKWVKIAERMPDVTFYGYTKSIEMVECYKDSWPFPNNLKLVYSFGGKEDHLIDTENHRHSQVFATKEALDAAGYIDATYDDSLAWNADTNKIGLVFHGAKSKNWGKQ